MNNLSRNNTSCLTSDLNHIDLTSDRIMKRAQTKEILNARFLSGLNIKAITSHFGDFDTVSIIEELTCLIAEAKKGNSEWLEENLIAQISTLGFLFNRLLYEGIESKNLNQKIELLNLALKAQKQFLRTFQNYKHQESIGTSINQFNLASTQLINANISP